VKPCPSKTRRVPCATPGHLAVGSREKLGGKKEAQRVQEGKNFVNSAKLKPLLIHLKMLKSPKKKEMGGERRI